MRKNREEALLTGVCAGIGDAFEIDHTFVRLAFALAFVFFGAGPLLYLILWLVMK